MARTTLTESQRQRMLALLDDNFRGVTPEQFSQDLAEKNWVILIHDEQQKLVGFSTLLLYQTEFEGEQIAVVYSGDTIIERAAWGSAALPRTWIQSVWELHRQECPNLPLYWLLITSGFRTYRFLSVFWREFFPAHGTQTPPKIERLRQQLAIHRFGPRYDAAAGVVHLNQPLRDDLLAVPAAKLSDPNVAFFVENNPGYIRGDELVCIAPLTESNLTSAGRRMVIAGKTAAERG